MNQPTTAAVTLLAAPIAAASSSRGRTEREAPGRFDAQLEAAVEAAKPAPEEKPPAPEPAAPTTPPTTTEAKAPPDAEEVDAPETDQALDPYAAVEGAALEGALLATVAVSETLLLASSPGVVLPSEAVTSVDVHAAADLQPTAAAVPFPTEGTFPTIPVEQGANYEAAPPESPESAPTDAAASSTIEPLIDAAAEPAALSDIVTTTSAASTNDDNAPATTTEQGARQTLASRSEAAAEPVVAIEKDADGAEQGDDPSTESDAPRSEAPLVAPDATAPAVRDAAEASTSSDPPAAPTAVDTAASRPAQGPSLTSSRPEGVERSAGEGAKPEIDPGRFVSRVSRAIDFARERGGGPIEMRLSPPELGSMQVRIELKEGVMTASLEVENPTARTTLLDNLPALRDRLEQQQIRIDKFDVEVRDDQQRGGDWRQQQDQQQSADRRNDPSLPRSLRTPATSTTATSSITPQRTNPFGPSGGINLVA